MSRAYAEYKKAHPNAKKETILKNISPQYEPNHGRTKQAFKDQTDINKIMDKARRTGVVSHVSKYGAEYGDYTDIPDLLEAHERMARAQEIFDDLPGEVRREFDNNMPRFYEWVNDPDNADKIESKLQGVARRGDQLPVVRKTGPGGAAREPEANDTATPVATPSGNDNSPSEG